ncbi:MAG: FAD:protein transferase [Solirubrobacteraceae bacterium]|nr:FAD:protein transferase [Solirubrobacteraceae bacterium]
MTTTTGTEARRVEQFACFGSTVTIRAEGREPALLVAVARARAIASEMQRRLSRFDPGSELCRLNADPRERVPASGLMRQFAAAVAAAGEQSGGLVDATCLPAVEAAGYWQHWDPGAQFAAGPPPAPDGDVRGWRAVMVEGGAVVRPRGVRLDSGGLGKGLAADLMAEALGGLDTWIVDCGGDLRVGGRRDRARTIQVRDPLDADAVLHAFRVGRAAVATSGTTRRRWRDGHHLIDPRTGRPAETGVLQVTAVAPTGLQAEVIAKTAILAGPQHAARVLVDGGVIVLAGGVVEIVPPAQNPGSNLTATSAWTSSPRTRRNPHEHITAAST